MFQLLFVKNKRLFENWAVILNILHNYKSSRPFSFFLVLDSYKRKQDFPFVAWSASSDVSHHKRNGMLGLGLTQEYEAD